ncbi:MAG: PEP-CTERM sorting domain-containing protein [Phycisphaerae bacterium]|nr:PEP-CTERM sorting domain-containing protein [Phycisphaerae bacterium]
MRWTTCIGVLCLAAAGASADSTTYVFQVESGSFSIDVTPENFVSPDPVTTAVGGTFAMTISSDDDEVGASDTFTLGNADIYNTDQHVLNILTLGGTATFPVGSARIKTFLPSSPGHLDADGVGAIDTDIYVKAYLIVAGTQWGWWDGTWTEDTWSVDVETFQVDLDIVDGVPLAVTLSGIFHYHWRFGGGAALADCGQEVVLQGILVPEPATIGLFAVAAGLITVRRRRN